jgi:hypothetical protein
VSSSSLAYQYVNDVGFFDLEVIRALLATIEYKPRISINWNPLMHHLSYARLQDVQDPASSYYFRIKQGVGFLEFCKPGRVNTDKCYRKIAHMLTYGSNIPSILNTIYQSSYQPNTHLYEAVKAALVMDKVDLVPQL